MERQVLARVLPGRGNRSRELSRAVAFWTTALRLGDWKITVRAALKKELVEREAFVDLNPHFREAKVALRRLTKFDTALEEDLVHELLHVVHWQASHELGKKEEDDIIPFEQSLNALAELLVALRRSSPSKVNCVDAN